MGYGTAGERKGSHAVPRSGEDQVRRRLPAVTPGLDVEMDGLTILDLLSPARSTAEMCRKMSLFPWAGAMKPKPLVGLNHFTVPLAIVMFLSWCVPLTECSGLAAQ